MGKTTLDLDVWFRRIGNAVNLLSTKDTEREQISRLYQGTFLGSPFSRDFTSSGKTRSELNFLFEYVRLVKSATYARNPYVFVRPRHYKYVAFAESMEKVINYYIIELKVKEKIRSALGDAVMQPPGVVGIGFRGEIEVTGKKRKNNNLYEATPNVKQKSPEQLGIYDETIKNYDLFLRQISSWNIAWPDGYHKPFRDAPYLIEIEDARLIDIFSNPMYKDSKYAIQAVTPSHASQARNKPLTMHADIPITAHREKFDDEMTIKRLFHVWDKRGQRRFTLVQGFIDDTIFERDWNYLIDGYPYYDLSFNEIPPTKNKANSFPLSDVVPMLPQLRDLSIINNAILNHGKRAGTVIISKKGTLTTEEITKLQEADDIEHVILESIDKDTLKAFATPALPSDWYKIRSLIIEDLMRISGFQQLLAQVKGIETATESENIKLGERLLTSEKVDIVEDFITNISRGFAGLAWQSLPRSRVAEILGEIPTQEMWPSLPADRDEAKRIIQRELQFRIDAGSTRPPRDEAVERKQWIDSAIAIKSAFPMRVKDDVFLEQWLKKLKFKDVEQMIIKYDDQEIAAAQQENKLLMKGIPQVVGPNENDMLHLQVHSQTYQIPGMSPTPQMDKHVLDHNKSMMMKAPAAIPQKGDKKPAGMSVAPEISRQGIPTSSDIMRTVTGNRGIGKNLGG